MFGKRGRELRCQVGLQVVRQYTCRPSHSSRRQPHRLEILYCFSLGLFYCELSSYWRCSSSCCQLASDSCSTGGIMEACIATFTTTEAFMKAYSGSCAVFSRLIPTAVSITYLCKQLLPLGAVVQHAPYSIADGLGKQYSCRDSDDDSHGSLALQVWQSGAELQCCVGSLFAVEDKEIPKTKASLAFQVSVLVGTLVPYAGFEPGCSMC